MQKIPLNLAKPGMKLAKAVERQDGLTVVGASVELTEALIERMAKMDIQRVVVEGSPVDLSGAGAGTVFSERLARLDHLFRRQARDPWMGKVKAFLARYFEIKAAAQAAQGQLEVEEVEGVEEGEG